MYKSQNKLSFEENNIPFMEIKLYQSLKTKNTVVLVKLFDFFIQTEMNSQIKYLFLILDYLQENNEKKIFLDYLRRIITSFKDQWKRYERRNFEPFILYRDLGMLFQYIKKWEILEELMPIKELFNFEPKDKDLFWDIRIELARIDLGFTSLETLEESIIQYTNEFIDKTRKYFTSIESLESLQELGKRNDYYKPYNKIKNILEESRNINNYDFIAKIEKPFFDLLVEIFNKYVTKSKQFKEIDKPIKILESLYNLLLRSDFNKLLSFYYLTNNKNEILELIAIEVEKRKIKNFILEPFMFVTTGLEEKTLEQFNDILDLFVILERGRKTTDEKNEILENIFKKFLNQNFKIELEICKLLEREYSRKRNLEVIQKKKDNLRKIFLTQLFKKYCLDVIELQRFDQLKIEQVLDREALSPVLKLEFSLAFAKAGYENLSNSYLESFLRNPAQIMWKLGEMMFGNINPSLDFNVQNMLARIKALRILGRTKEAKEELDDLLLKLTINKNSFYATTIEDMFIQAVKLKDKSMQKKIIEEYVKKVTDRILDSKTEVFAFENQIMRKGPPDEITSEEWNELKIDALKKFKQIMNKYIRKPLLVGNFDILVTIMYNLNNMNDKETENILLQEIEKNLFFVMTKYLPESLQSKFSYIEKPNEPKKEDQELFKEIMLIIPQQPMKEIGKDKKINYWQIWVIIESIIQLYEKTGENKKKKYFEKVREELLDYYKKDSPTFRNIIAINDLKKIFDSEKAEKEKVMESLEIVRKARMYKGNQIRIVESYVNKRIKREIELY